MRKENSHKSRICGTRYNQKAKYTKETFFSAFFLFIFEVAVARRHSQRQKTMVFVCYSDSGSGGGRKILKILRAWPGMAYVD